MTGGCCTNGIRIPAIAKWRASFERDGITEPQWTALSMMFLLLSASAACINYFNPFVAQMVKKEFGYSEVDAGTYVGIVTASFNVGRMFGSCIWGGLSDKLGKQVALSLSFFMTILATVAFGFSRTIIAAITSGLVAGLVNGIVVAGKALLYEVSDSSNQSYGMSVLSASWGFGSIIGPMAGGYLTRFRPLPAFPYALPTLVVTGTSSMIFVVAIFFMRKSLAKFHASENSRNLLDIALNTGDDTDDDNDDKQKLKKQAEAEANSNAAKQFASMPAIAMAYGGCNSCSGLSMRHRSLQLLSPDGYLLPGDLAQSQAHLSCNNCLAEPRKDEADDGTEAGAGCCASADKTMRMLSSPNCLITITVYFIQSMCAVSLRILHVVWCPTAVEYGGLGFSNEKLATLLILSSLALLIIQPLIFPFLERRFGCSRLYMYNLLVMLITTVPMPLCYYCRSSPVLMWTVLIVLICGQNISYLTGFTCLAILINNSVPSSMVGSMNGVAMSCSSLGRLVAPVLAGWLFSFSIAHGTDYPIDCNLAFQVLGLAILMSSIAALFIAPGLNYKYDERNSKPATAK